ncbi:hypothetical protein D3C80_1493170 [compost metagenome]
MIRCRRQVHIHQWLDRRNLGDLDRRLRLRLRHFDHGLDHRRQGQRQHRPWRLGKRQWRRRHDRLGCDLGITGLLFTYRRLELVRLDRYRHCLIEFFGGLLQQAIEVALQGHLWPAGKLLRAIHQATCKARFCVSRCLSKAR